jgi:hypothetical protein
MKREFSGQIFEKYSNIKFHENQSSGSQVVAWGRTDRHLKLMVAFHSFAKAPINRSLVTAQPVTRTLRLKVSRLLYAKGNVLIAQHGVVISFPFDVVTDEHENLNPRYL